MASPTKKYKKLAKLFGFLSWAIILIPLIVFLGIAFVQGAIVSKLILSMTTFAGIVIFSIGAIQKLRLRSPFWIVMSGISMCIAKITGILLLMGLFVVLDELVLSPLAKHYKSLYTINNEIDKR